MEVPLHGATEDVTETVRWLLDEGFEPSDVRGGPEASFGNEAVVFRHTNGRAIEVVKDRDQWTLRVQDAKVADLGQLELLIAVMNEDSWTSSGKNRSEPLLEQLPEGVSWRQTLPTVLEFIDSQPDLKPKLQEAARQRAKFLFG